MEMENARYVRRIQKNFTDHVTASRDIVKTARLENVKSWNALLILKFCITLAHVMTAMLKTTTPVNAKYVQKIPNGPMALVYATMDIIRIIAPTRAKSTDIILINKKFFLF